MQRLNVVPEAREWKNGEALLYLLKRGPRCINPNRSQYADGWYDDGRNYSLDDFRTALTHLKKEDRCNKEDRLERARSIVHSNSFTTFVVGLSVLGELEDPNQTIQEDIAELLATNHLHEWHRFHMIPPDYIRQWNIPQLTEYGHEFYMANYPLFLRRGNRLYTARGLKAQFHNVFREESLSYGGGRDTNKEQR